MSENSEKNLGEQNRKGVGKIASIFGQSTVDSFKGSVAGGIAGAIVGALSGKIGKFLNSETLGKLSEYGIKGSAAVGAVVGAIGWGVVGSIIGLVNGYRKAKAADKQFNEITTENRELKSKLSGIETAAAIATGGNPKSFVSDLETQRAKQAALGTSVA